MTAIAFHKRRKSTGGGFRDGHGYMPCANGCRSSLDGLRATGTHLCTMLDHPPIYLCPKCCKEWRALVDEVLQ